MKFRDPETGAVCLTIRPAVLRFCSHNSCTDCQLFRFKNRGCLNWTENHPTEAARLMGYEVIEDSSSDSSTEIDDTPTTLDDTPTTLDDTPTTLDDTPTGELVNQRPRLAEILGVKEDEEWKYDGIVGTFRIHNGVRQYKNETSNVLWWNCGREDDLWEIINHPESIIRAPRLTEPEIAIMRAVGARWVSRDKDSAYVTLHREKPCLIPENGRYYYNVGYIGSLDENLFPSVALGDCIELEEEK